MGWDKGQAFVKQREGVFTEFAIGDVGYVVRFVACLVRACPYGPSYGVVSIYRCVIPCTCMSKVSGLHRCLCGTLVGDMLWVRYMRRCYMRGAFTVHYMRRILTEHIFRGCFMRRIIMGGMLSYMRRTSIGGMLNYMGMTFVRGIYRVRCTREIFTGGMFGVSDTRENPTTFRPPCC